MSRLAFAAALGLAGCFNPTFDNPTCGPGGACPSGTSCVQNVCVAGGGEIDAPTGADGAIDGAADASIDAATDAAIDGPPIDGPPIDGPPIDGPGPACGNGVVEAAAGENCDDRNDLACGTCSAGCTTSISPRAATGSITAALGNQQQDGETFTLDDGFNPPTVFEWNLLGTGVGAGRVRVDYTQTYGQGMMAMALRDAVNSVGGTLLITATHSGGPTAMLDHDRLTSLGNRPITETVSNGQFVVQGMSGGAAGDCPANVGCNQAADCASGVCNTTTRVCQ